MLNIWGDSKWDKVSWRQEGSMALCPGEVVTIEHKKLKKAMIRMFKIIFRFASDFGKARKRLEN